MSCILLQLLPGIYSNLCMYISLNMDKYSTNFYASVIFSLQNFDITSTPTYTCSVICSNMKLLVLLALLAVVHLMIPAEGKCVCLLCLCLLYVYVCVCMCISHQVWQYLIVRIDLKNVLYLSEQKATHIFISYK